MSEFEKTVQHWVQEESSCSELENYELESENEDKENSDQNISFSSCNINSSWTVENFSFEESGEDGIKQQKLSNSNILVAKQTAASDDYLYLFTCACNQKFKKLEKQLRQIKNDLKTLGRDGRRTRKGLDKLRRRVEYLEYAQQIYFENGYQNRH